MRCLELLAFSLLIALSPLLQAEPQVQVVGLDRVLHEAEPQPVRGAEEPMRHPQPVPEEARRGTRRDVTKGPRLPVHTTSVFAFSFRLRMNRN